MTGTNWEELIKNYVENTVVSGKVKKNVPGGVIVDVFGHDGFLPISQIPAKYKNKQEEILNEVIDFQILKINAFANNIVVSRKALFKSLVVGEIYDAFVKKVVSFGAFVTIDCIDGLIPSKELSWQYFDDINKVIKVNDVIKVKVLDIDKTSHRVFLSHKACISSPWATFDTKKYYLGAVVNVIVVRVSDQYLLVTLANGCTGRLYKNEISWEEDVDLLTTYSVGDTLKVRIYSVDVSNQKFTVSIKRLDGVQRIKVGFRMFCTISKETEEGFILKTNKEVPVFLPFSEISWLKRYDIRDYIPFKKPFQVIIIANGDKCPNTASIRRMYPDPISAYTPNSIHKGIISGESPNVYFVNFEDGLSGIIPKKNAKGRSLKYGQQIRTIVIRSDKDSRLIEIEPNIDSEFTGNDIMLLLNLKPCREVGILKKLLSEAINNKEIDSSYAAGKAFVLEKAREVLNKDK